ncbi:response regulator transcription factor [Paenibacillus tianjinensis]|uniref:Response regulator transcription factor n=1 Tax=Paenibacillus tianjinensis TaxID=2810347 RepID=A0ABX7L8L4_9BACL|nr:response regulator transcription factor [Paenibacillus tianjinensis]QSF44499.1 response regulator transcription factor [Paenibacillus tianjinensis]
MIKVLIVDDEPKLREGLRSLIPWEEEGYTVVATAANGFEALEKFHSFAPSLIVADIRMPGMDGLELIAELRKQNANCHVLILSGYADFEYAKRAISCHIDGYLLKPVDEEELISYLQELRVTIEREEQFSRLQTEAEVSNHEAWLRGLLQPGSEDIAVPEAASRLGLQGESEVILLQLMRPHKGEDGREERVRSLLERYLPPERAIFFSLPPFLGLLLKEPLKDEAARAALWQDLNRIIAREGLDFYAASGGAALEPEQAAASYTAARELLEQAFFGRREILVSGAVEQWAEAVKEPGELADSERDEEMELLLAVETGSTEVLSPLVRQIICKLVETRYDETYIKDNLIRIVSSTIARLEAVNPDVRTLISENASPASEVYNSYYLSDILSMVADYLEHIAKQLNTGGRGDEIKRITDLIQRRYNENLKLGMLAQIFNYNSAYLGKMFKNQIGEHFNTYLDKVRIEKAKQFLTQGMKVYEVAERVGYMNADYFNAKFRKYVGVSPSAFRKEQ